MIELIPLCSARVEILPPLAVGSGPAGARTIGAITSVTLKGKRLTASLAGPAAGDFLVRSGPYGVIDARLVLRSDNGALIYVAYGGRLDVSNPASGIVAYVAPVFETGDERYAWLNGIQAVGKGVLSQADDKTLIDYEFFEVR